MAPNIKEINDALLSLDLSNHVLSTAKYAPLTSEVASTNSPADMAPLEEANGNVTIPTCLSTERIVSNLLSEGQQRLSSSTCTSSDDTSDDTAVVVAPHAHDPAHPQHSYWDWDTSPQATSYDAKRRALIERIVEEERAREMTSAGHVIQTILESQGEHLASSNETIDIQNIATTNDADESYWSFPPRSTDPADTIHAPHTRDPNHPLADYWTWDASPKSADEQRQVLIDWILREEAARQATCMDAVVQGLIQSASASSVGAGNEIAVEESKESAEGYWDW